MTEIIPAIDIIDGKCVRLTQGDYQKATRYYDYPLDVALRFADYGLKRLHLVDLDGAREKKVINYKTLELLASSTPLHIDFGGGIQSDEDIRIAFECGARQVTGGSIAVKNRELFCEWLSRYGTEKIILGADTKDKKVAVSGWQESSDIHLFDLLEYYIEKGASYCISTDVAKDGMLQGPSFDLYKEIREKYPDLKIIASGGVSGIGDIEKLAQLGVFGVIIGKAFYEGHISLSELGNLANASF